jgi:hypothetical protein
MPAVSARDTEAMDSYEGLATLEWWANPSTCSGEWGVRVMVRVTGGGWSCNAVLEPPLSLFFNLADAPGMIQVLSRIPNASARHCGQRAWLIGTAHAAACVSRTSARCSPLLELPGSASSADGLESLGAFDGLANFVAGCGMAVLGPGRSSGTSAARLGNTTRTEQTRMFLNPRRTRAVVRRSGLVGFSQGRRRSAASGRARRSWVWAMTTNQVHRSAASGVRTFGVVQPRICFPNLK